MGKAYRTGKGISASASVANAQICDACRAVIERARGRGEMGRFRIKVDASLDTIGRMMDDDQYGGWTVTRLTAMRAWEEDEYGTHQIAIAMGGATSDGRAEEVERNADAALISLLGLSRQIAEFRPKGYDRRELRLILEVAQQAEPALGKFIRDAKARMRSGK